MFWYVGLHCSCAYPSFIPNMVILFQIIDCIIVLIVPKRFRLAKDTTFGQRHLNKWSQSSFSLWMAFARIVNHYFVNNVGQN
ncbi:hypothetical protein AAZX31_09G233500 [Glycine max]